MDSKDIKDYLHLYLGCECRCYSTWDTDGWKEAVTPEILIEMSDEDSRIGGLRLVLRPLSDMTEDERAHINGMEQNNSSYPTMAYALAPHFHYLLSKGFDLFNLIDAGLAIKKSD